MQRTKFWNPCDVEQRPERFSKSRIYPNPFPTYHRLDFIFRCTVCHTHFLSFCRLRRHFKQTHDLKEFKCKYRKCVDSFTTESEMEMHIAQRHKQKECPHCKRLVHESYLAKHVQETHEGDCMVCELCGKICLNRYTYNWHHRTKHNDIVEMVCDLCKRT